MAGAVTILAFVLAVVHSWREWPLRVEGAHSRRRGRLVLIRTA